MYAYRLDKDGKKIKPPFPKDEYMGYNRPGWNGHNPNHLSDAVRRACAYADADDGELYHPSKPKIPHTQEELNKYITLTKGRFRQGDYVVWDSIAPDSPQMGLGSVCYIIAVENDFNKIIWNETDDHPRAFLIVSIGASMGTGMPVTPYWSTLNWLRHLTTNELNKWIRNDVRVSDFVESIEASYQAGTLKVR